jgi:hypothetical protein
MASANGRPVWSIDDAVTQAKPLIELRGQLYELADLLPGEEEAALLELAEAEERIIARSEAVGKADSEERRNLLAELQEASGDAVAATVRRAIAGVPEDVARSITVLEYKALMSTLGALRELPVPPVKKKDQAP